MRVCIDGQSAVAQRAGVGRYTKLLVQHLGPLAGEDALELFYFDFRRRGARLGTESVRHKAVHWVPGRVVQAAWKRIGWPPFDVFAGPADVYHFPNFTLPPLRQGASVVTIHDLGFMRFPEFAEEKNLRYLSATIRNTVSRADAIITVSRFCADEVAELLQVNRERLFPIHHGIAADFAAPGAATVQHVREALGLDRPYLLTVGTLEPRKNVPFLIDVFEKLETFDGDLVIAGMPGWKYEPILERMRTSTRARNIRYVRYVSDEQLPALYAGAELFVFSSFYEGFGFPPLEAMAADAPVVSSSGGSLGEVLGDGARVVDGFDVDEWVEALRAALADTEWRRQTVQRGRAQAAQYRWERTARETWAVYRSVCP